MSAKPIDHRPKVISFHTTLDGLNIAARQSVLWPCHTFNISIPEKKKSGLNVFEETVLKLTEVESGNTEKIADIACLFDRDKDGKIIVDKYGKKQTALVSFIQNRLNQLGLLNDRYELSENGRELLNEWQNKSDGNLEYTLATVFVDLLSGKLLPFVSTEQLSYKKISRIGDKGFIDFLINPTNEKSKVHARQIRPTKDSYWKVVPDSNDIIRAIREYKKKYKRNALLKQGIDQYPPPIPIAEAISLHDNPELVYLHCNVLIQTGNSDLLVTDGCGFGFSESFSSYLTSQNLQWVIDIKKKGIIERITLEKKDVNSSKGEIWKYPAVTKLFKHPEYGINFVLNKLNDSPETDHEEKEYVAVKQQIGSKLYSSIEYALALVVAEYPVPEWEQIFSSQNYENNERLLYGFAKKIGLSLSPKNKKLLQVKAGAIRHIQYGKVKLQPLLAIAIAGAATKYSTHPVHDLARNHSGFLDFAQSLKKLRDPVSHGDISDYKKDAWQLKSDIDQTQEVLKTLFPTITSELSEGDHRQNIENDINQERLKAEAQLDEYFGLSFVYEMERDLKEQLIRIEQMFAKPLDDQMITVEVLKFLAASMQTILRQKLRGRMTGHGNNSKNIARTASARLET